MKRYEGMKMKIDSDIERTALPLRALAIAALALMASACTVGPDYRRPQVKPSLQILSVHTRAAVDRNKRI